MSQNNKIDISKYLDLYKQKILEALSKEKFMSMPCLCTSPCSHNEKAFLHNKLLSEVKQIIENI